MTRTPPLHLLEETRLFTARMNITISIGLMSVPVATMSTGDGDARSYWLRKAWIRSARFADVTL